MKTLRYEALDISIFLGVSNHSFALNSEQSCRFISFVQKIAYLIDNTHQIEWQFNNQPVSEHFTDALPLSNGSLLIQDVSRLLFSLFRFKYHK